MATLSPSRRMSRARLQPVTISATAFRQALPWLLVSLSLSMIALVGQVPSWTLLVFGGCILWRYLIARRGGPLPSMIVRLLVFIPVASGIMLKYGSNPGAAGMLTFLIALLSLKILELRSARDFTVVSLLGYFMVLSGFFYDQSLSLSLYLGMALLTNTVALIRCHSGGQREIWPAVRLALGLTAQAVPLVVLLFVIFPRLQGNFLRRLGGATTGLTGMSEHLQPGSFSSLVQSTDSAFRAKIGAGITVPQRELYWRGLVLDVCESSMSWKAGGQAQLTDGGVTAPRSNSRRVDQTITLFPQGERWLFALDRPVGIRPSSAVKAQLFTSDVLQSRVPVESRVIYTAVSELNYVDPPMTQGRHDSYVRLPADLSERAKTLARSWHPPGRTDADVIQAARQFFRNGGFTYTLDPGLLPKEGALDHFLFKSRHGFCEHYAAAFSTLIRAAGLPSRIVIGYQGGEYNSWSGHYLVLQSDAHAWSEVWVEGKGWQREDPTAVVAPDRVSFGAENYAVMSADESLSAEARLRRLSELNSPGSWRWLLHHTLQAWDGLDQQWNLFVLGYDQDKQQSVFQGLGVSNFSWMGGTALALAAVFTILTLGTAAVRALDYGPAKTRDPVKELYERFCRRVASVADVRRVDSEGPLDFARRAALALPHRATDIESVTMLYVTARYALPDHAKRGAHESAFMALRDAVAKFRPRKIES